MVELKVNIEEGDGCHYIHAAELLGCFAKRESRSEAIDAILKDAKVYSEWLISIDIGTHYKTIAKELLTGISGFDILQEVNNVHKLRDDRGASALFETDKEPISDELFDIYITIINKLPAELLRIVFHYSTDELKQHPIPDKPSINEELKDLYDTEMYYISLFGEKVEEKFFEEIKTDKDELESLSLLERVVKVRQGAINILRYYDNLLGDKIFKQTRNPDFIDEEWTIKKLFRKFIVHEREKTEAIRALVDILESRKSIEKKEINNK
ncbi:MAG: hypothetical protein JXA54_15465 [Candidatus Heimdallarchaeota archaeon]|nr:hypothetical protein [Candidatus Heimdallarchaeota archaeon]